MNLFFITGYLLFSMLFNQYYRQATKKMDKASSLTVLISLVGFTLAIFLFPFKGSFPTSKLVYLCFFISLVFTCLQNRLSTQARSMMEASTYCVLKQITPVFMIIVGFVFLKEELNLTKIIGVVLIISSNILLFYPFKTTTKKAILYGVLANIFRFLALLFDINLSNIFPLTWYLAMIFVFPLIINVIIEKICLNQLKKEWQVGDKKAILITGVSWYLMLFCQLKAYQSGSLIITSIFCSLTVLTTMIGGYLFFGERKDIRKKLLVTLLITLGLILV